MARCEQCGAEFSNWFGDLKRVCPSCERQAAATAPAVPRPKLPTPFVTWTLIALNVGVFLAMVLLTHQFADFDGETALRWGADYGPATVSGEWWRMLTSMFLHGGILHIAVNMWALLNLGFTAELFYGRRNFFLIYMLSGFAGSSATLIWRPETVSVGASGALYGVMGALAALLYLKHLPVDKVKLRKSVGSIGAVIVFNLLISARIPIINNAAHVGGLIAGAILGFALPALGFPSEREKSPLAGNMAIALVICLMIVIAVSGTAKLGPEVELYRAEKAFDAQDLNTAVQHADKAAALHPSSARSNYMIGAIYVNAGHPDKAIPVLEEAQKELPQNKQIQVLLDEARSRARGEAPRE